MVVVSGISLRCTDEATGNTDDNPFRPMEKSEPEGAFCISPSDYLNLAPTDENLPGFPVLGILHTSLTHRQPECGKILRGNILHRFVNSRMIDNNVMGRKRDFFFRYKLKTGFDLGVFGMALLFDNTSPDHCSLIRIDEGRERYWDTLSNRPVLAWPDDVGFPDDHQDLDDTLREILTLSPAKYQPEVYETDVAGLPYLAVPCLAARFEMHDFLIRASAEPVPLDHFENDTQRCVFLGIFLVHYLSDGDVNWAIQQMEAAEYLVDNVDSACRLALLGRMYGIRWDTEWESVDIKCVLDMDPCEDLIEAIRVLERVEYGEDLPPATPLSSTAGTGNSPWNNATEETEDTDASHAAFEDGC
eukprot:scaffold3577_cov60-Attheya_sp.AAC.4